MSLIRYFNEGSSFQLESPRKTSNWIKSVINQEGQELSGINFIFCNDRYLSRINQDYLNHSTLTDIITFDSREFADAPLEGDIYISVPRVRANAKTFGVPLDQEIHRVLVHGVLHLLGYSDKGVRKKAEMRKKEDTYLSLRR